MGSYLIKRILQMLVVMLIVSIGVFLLVDLLPADPIYAMLGDSITDETYWKAYYELGLDKPLLTRYFDWLGNALHGEFGVSYQFHVDVKELLAPRLKVTIYLSVLATLICMPLGILFGVISAVNRGKPIDNVITLVSNACSCLPQFWIGIFLLYIFAMKLGWLPSFGFTMPPWKDWTLHFRQLIMPLICLSIDGIAGITRQSRSSMLENIRQDYVRTAKSKGLAKNKVIFVHTLKNSLIPHCDAVRSAAFLHGGRFRVCRECLYHSWNGLFAGKIHYGARCAGGAGMRLADRTGNLPCLYCY